MTSLTRKWPRLLALCVLSAPVAATFCGCKKEEPPPPPAPPPPQGPVTVDPAAVAEYLSLNPKVSVENAQPMECSEEEVKAMLQFMSAFAAGDAGTMKSMMDSTGRKALDHLIETGEWEQETSRIIQVNLVDRTSVPAAGDVFTFNVIMPHADRVQQDWIVTPHGDTFTFSPYAVIPVSKQMEAALKAAAEAAANPDGQNQPEDNRDRNRDPRRRIPQPNDPTAPGKSPGGPG